MKERRQAYISHSTSFIVLFLVGFLVKYNILAVRIYQIPVVSGLVGKNLFFIGLTFLVIYPLINVRRVRIALIVFSLFFTLFFFTNLWYNRYFGNYLSLSDMMMGRGMRPFKVLLWQLVRPFDILFILDVIVLFLFSRLSPSDAFKRPFTRFKRGYTVLGFGLLALLLSVQVYLTNERVGGSGPGLLYQRSTSAFVNVYGIVPLYSFEYAMLFHPQAYEPQEEQKITQGPNIENELPGQELVKEGQNIIAIQVESLDANIIGHSHNGREVTPFLNRLKSESLYFENFYAQHVNGSFDAEFSFFTSIYSINKNYGFKVNDLSSFDSIVEKLSRRGYTTLAFHGNDKEFFFRDKAYEELGFDRFYSLEDFDIDRLRYPEVNRSFGVNDWDFFNQSYELLQETEEPFFAFFITVTSHTPFDFYPAEEEIEEFADIENPLVRSYFNSAAFADAALESFFTQLEAGGLTEDSLILIYADHDAGVEKELYSSSKEFLLERPVKLPENIPLFIMHPDIEPGISGKEGSPTDLAPTILDLIGEDEKPSDFVGHSMLSDVEVPILFMHEVPQILHRGNLYVQSPDGLEFAGFVPGEGTPEKRMPQEDEFLLMIDYLRTLLLERRSDTAQ